MERNPPKKKKKSSEETRLTPEPSLPVVKGVCWLPQYFVVAVLSVAQANSFESECGDCLLGRGPGAGGKAAPPWRKARLQVPRREIRKKRASRNNLSLLKSNTQEGGGPLDP